jgi:hypothetical protein
MHPPATGWSLSKLSAVPYSDCILYTVLHLASFAVSLANLAVDGNKHDEGVLPTIVLLLAMLQAASEVNRLAV